MIEIDCLDAKLNAMHHENDADYNYYYNINEHINYCLTMTSYSKIQ
jgi:hypothetical protein